MNDEDDHHDNTPQPPRTIITTTTTTTKPSSFMGDDTTTTTTSSSTTTTPCATTATVTLPLLPVVYHPGRYKKLRKRATMKASPIHPSSGTSGITTLDDWYELVQLHQLHHEQQQQQQQPPSTQPPKKKKLKEQKQPHSFFVDNKTNANEPLQLPGIQILQPSTPRMHENTPSLPPPPPLLLQEDGMNNNNELPPQALSNQPNIMDAVRHQKFLRHRLIHVLLQKQPLSHPSSPNHPRPRIDIDTNNNNNSNNNHSMTRVISVHNPVAIHHVVLLEIHVTTPQEAEAMIQSILVVHGRRSNAVVLPTTWFHTNGTEPRSITDAVMYEKTYDHPHHHHSKIIDPRRDDPETITTVEDLYHLLKPFVLSVQQWEKENYPHQRRIPPPEDDKIFNGSTLGSNPWTVMALNEARQFIRPYEIHDDDDDDNQDRIRNNESSSSSSLPPFVGHYHPRDMVDPPPMKAHRTNDDNTPIEIKDPNGRRIFAMDCEMVETAMGKELARVTVCELIGLTPHSAASTVTCTSETIPMQTAVRLDTVVQPYNRITNYLTKYSGISASTYLDGDSDRILRLEQVQAILLQWIHPRDIVIGHSLENDLYALRFLHPTVVDTAIMFQQKQNHNNRDNHRIAATTATISYLLGKSPSSPTTTTRTFKYSLRHLAAVLLHKEIQSASGPHCSEEDAVTALQLAVSRAIRGPSFGISHRGNSSNWFTKLSNQSKDAITAVAVGPVKWLRQHILSSSSSSSPNNAIHALQCESIDDSNSKAIARWVTGPTRRASVVWSKMELSRDSNNAGRMSEWVQDVITKLSCNNSVVLMIPIQINYSDTKELHQQRQFRRSNPRSTIPWSESDEKQYQTSLEICRNGYVLYITTKD